jgi:hypothetical protein
MRIEAAACSGKPVYFIRRLDDEGNAQKGSEAEEEEESPYEVAVLIAILVLFALLIIGSALLVIRNLALGRGDRKGAFRIALLVFGLLFAHWLVTGHHVAGFSEFSLVMRALGRAATFAVLAWLMYITLEPYIRRFWPQAMVSWNRLLAGRFNDPLVGRDILLGMAISGLFGPLWYVAMYVAIKDGVLAPFPLEVSAILQGGRHAVGNLLSLPLQMLAFASALILGYMLLRVVLRRQWLAAAVICLLFGGFSTMNFAGLFGSAGAAAMLFGLAAGLFTAIVYIVVLIRFGVVAFMATLLFDALAQGYAMTADFSSPFFTSSLIGPVVLIAIALYAFKVSLAGRPLFKES